METIVEHHVEKAFKEHAEKRGCTDFKIEREERPDLGFHHKMVSHQENITLQGEYIWCGRLFLFRGFLNNGGMGGTVVVQALTRCPVKLASLEVAYRLVDQFPGYGLIIQDCIVPGEEHLGKMFWGINIRVCDLDFSERQVNGISHFLDCALREFEDGESGEDAG